MNIHSLARQTYFISVTCLWLMSAVYSNIANAEVDAELVQLQHAWAHANFEIPEADTEAAFKPLAESAHQYTLRHPNNPQAMIWEAIILSGYAEAKGGLGALKLATQARDLLLNAEKLSTDNINTEKPITERPNTIAVPCELYYTLGALYEKVPSRPFGFGDKAKANHYFLKALQLEPSNMDANFFYGDYLNGQGEYAKAIEYLHKALQAPPRVGYEDIDSGRKTDIQAAISLAQTKLHR